MMGFLKQATLQRVFSYLTNGCFWPEAAIRGVEILARRTSAVGWKAAIEPGPSGKLHFGHKHRITESISEISKKKIISI